MGVINKKGENKPPNRTLQSAIGLGYQFIAAMLFFVGIGYYIDMKHGGGSLFTLIGVGLTFLYGGYEVWKLVKFLEEEDSPDDAESQHGPNP